jgi:thioredoxin reductase
VDNWPGDNEGVQGPDLMVRMQQHAERFNTEIINDTITKVDFSARPYETLRFMINKTNLKISTNLKQPDYRHDDDWN